MKHARKVNRGYNAQFSLPNSPSHLGPVEATKDIKHEPCTVQVVVNGEKRACGLPAHFIAGGNRFCREKHMDLAFATAKKRTSTPSVREQMLLAACQ